jgi:hypothetical protein
MPEKVRGLVERGNVGDLTDRPRVKNADGSVSTIRSMSFNDGKREVLIPTANDVDFEIDDEPLPKLAMPERELAPIVERMKGYIETNVPQQSQERKVANETMGMNARDAVNAWADPKAAWAVQNVPGMRQLAQRLSQSTRDRNPQERDISSVRREFSNENEKDAYIERIRKAQAAAKK